MDLDIYLSASPPLFNHNGFHGFNTKPSFHNHHVLPPVKDLYSYQNSSTMCPTHSCSTIQDDRITMESKTTVRGKKRVWFADDKGLALTHVRFMTEPSDCPPNWTDEFLDHITRGVKPQLLEDSTWEVTFSQPASDYMEFRNKLESNCLSLENVIVKDDDQLTGTIKVKNLSFEKEVFVRVTFDLWQNYQDLPATFVPNGMECSSLYDTFSFLLTIPSSAVNFEMVEFCACFKSHNREFWDNNGGSNYQLIRKKKETEELLDMRRFVDAFKAEFDSWGNFASWNHLVSQGPYW